MFLRGKPLLCAQMQRPTSKENRLLKSTKTKVPDLYEMSKKNPLPEDKLDEHQQVNETKRMPASIPLYLHHLEKTNIHNNALSCKTNSVMNSWLNTLELLELQQANLPAQLFFTGLAKHQHFAMRYSNLIGDSRNNFLQGRRSCTQEPKESSLHHYENNIGETSSLDMQIRCIDSKINEIKSRRTCLSGFYNDEERQIYTDL